MTPEEFNRIKEAEKEHLRALKKLKDQLRQARQLNNVARAMKDIEDAPGDEITGTHDEMVDRLAMETIQGEVRLEMALSETEETETPDQGSPTSESTGEAGAEDPSESLEEHNLKVAQSDAELKKLRAQDLVRQIKLQMGLADVKKKQNRSSAVTHEDSSQEESEDIGMGKEKTLDSTEPEELPEKTIGRIPRKKS